jgi:hypothetical protein
MPAALEGQNDRRLTSFFVNPRAAFHRATKAA